MARRNLGGIIMAYRYLLPIVVSVLIMAAVRSQAATIDVGNHLLMPNTPDQTISINVSGGDPVAGFNLFAQVGDGGPELSNFGHPAGNDGPSIASVDLKSGTIFSNVPDPQDDQDGIPQVAISSIEISTPNASTVADGLLASLTIDTTGFASGTWDLLLDDVLPMFANGPFATDFAGTPATIVNGSIQVGSSIPGDFDSSGIVDAIDINLLHVAIQENSADVVFDVDGTGNVDADDVTHLVEEILGTFYGDADLNGTVDSNDLNQLGINWQIGDESFCWSDGDFNGDHFVDSEDLNTLGINWQMTSNMAANVSEPRAAPFFLLGLLLAYRSRWR